MKSSLIFTLIIFSFFCTASGQEIPSQKNVELIEVAQSEQLWTGIAVSKEGRIFVCYPRWFPDVPVSVAEIMATGTVRPFPNEEWNTWNPEQSPGDHFICVQSVYIDKNNFLWILDPALPPFRGKKGSKLIKVNLENNRIAATIFFDESITPAESYLNDVRIDTKREYAYITDSGTGALVIVNLKNGKYRRLLSNHPSTKAEDITLNCDGTEVLQEDGTPLKVHSDGIALDNEGHYLYYQALTGRSLYRIETKWLRDETLSDEEISKKVEFLGKTGAADGIMFGPDNKLYLSAIEHNAIKRYTSEGKVELVIKDPRLAWTDSFAFDSKGFLYTTVSQLHLLAKLTEPFRIFKLKP